MEDRKESDQTVVFICWSGERSHALADALRDFLPSVIQSVEPFVSEKDIEAGEAWDAKLMGMIRAARFGIACITAENRGSPWLHFEAGALSNAVGGEERLCPYLLELPIADLRPPLTRFQAKTTNENDTLALVESINARCARPLPAERLRSVFGKYWHDLERVIKGIKPGAPQAVPVSVLEEKVNEILTTVRDLARATAQSNMLLSSSFPITTGWSPGTLRPIRADGRVLSFGDVGPDSFPSARDVASVEPFIDYSGHFQADPTKKGLRSYGEKKPKGEPEKK